MLLALANWSTRLAVGWLVLVETESVFLAAAVYAVQKAPLIFAAPIAGYISDRVDRSRMLVAAGLYKSAVACGLAVLALGGVSAVWPVFLLVGLLGVGQSIEVPATQGLITDTVPRRTAMNAVTLHSTGARTVGAVGGLVGGIVIKSFGIPVALFAGCAVFLAGAVYMFVMPVPRVATGAVGKIGANIFLESARSLASLIRIPVVRVLLLATIIVEIFGFAYHSLLPGFARGVLELDADGLGTLAMMSGFGSVIGVVILSSLGDFKRKGMLIIGLTVGYGVMLIAFAGSGIFPVSLALITGVGAMAACFDAMQWTTLQQNVPDEQRGQAIGGWVFAIGLGWIGPLILGAVGEALGVQWALAGAGAVVALTGIAAYFTSAGLRKV
jgi:MFS family permease